MNGHARPGGLDYLVRIFFPHLLGILKAPISGQVAVERIVGTGLIGADIRRNIALDHLGQQLGKVLELLGIDTDSYIFNASKKNMIARFLAGEELGTRVTTIVEKGK